MISDRWPRAKRLLNALLEAEPNDPDAWLDEQCDDPALRAEVKSLFSAQEGTFLEGESPREWLGGPSGEPDEHGPATPVVRPETGTQIGAYRLVEEIGLGGMSVVYRAERVGADFEQTVAVKLLQRRLLADDAEQRFRAERQVLASLDHPNIAQLIDGGVAEGGRPYLVMELVEGTPITAYADAHDLNLEARLDLLEQAFDAVKAAHRQLVVHRDLKPANVLVTEMKDGPRVKLLDFGIAKLLDDALPVTRPETRTGHHLMTPSYAAPEQVTGADVTTGTDVYQLGVLAYELLAGRRPFDVEDKSATEIERLITEVDPLRPSERARGGPVSPGALQGDLDQILLTALRKEPERRYGSVEAMEADLERHRSGQPVEARPATLGYRARKFAGRHRWGVGVGVAFLIVIAVSGTLLVRQRMVAERQRDRAQVEAEKAARVSGFLTNLFQANNPREAQGDTITARALLRRGVRRAEALEDQPDVQAQMLSVIGEVHLEHGRFPKADSLFGRALALRRKAEAGRAPIASSLGNLAYTWLRRDRDRKADSLFQEALRLMPSQSPHRADRAELLTGHGIVLHDLSEFEKAEKRHRAALKRFRAAYDGPHPKIAQAQNNLAMLIHDQGRLEEAERLYRKTLATQKKLLSAPHPDLADTMNNLATVLRNLDKHAESKKRFRKVLRMDRALYGKEHPYVAGDYSNVASALMQRGQHAEAIGLLRQAETITKKLLPATRVQLAGVYQKLGRCFVALEDYAHAEPALRKAFVIQRKREKGTQGDDRIDVLEDMVDLYDAWGRPAKAAAYRDTLAAASGVEGS